MNSRILVWHLLLIAGVVLVRIPGGTASKGSGHPPPDHDFYCHLDESATLDEETYTMESPSNAFIYQSNIFYGCDQSSFNYSCSVGYVMKIPGNSEPVESIKLLCEKDMWKNEATMSVVTELPVCEVKKPCSGDQPSCHVLIHVDPSAHIQDKQTLEFTNNGSASYIQLCSDDYVNIACNTSEHLNWNMYNQKEEKYEIFHPDSSTTKITCDHSGERPTAVTEQGTEFPTLTSSWREAKITCAVETINTSTTQPTTTSFTTTDSSSTTDISTITGTMDSSTTTSPSESTNTGSTTTGGTSGSTSETTVMNGNSSGSSTSSATGGSTFTDTSGSSTTAAGTGTVTGTETTDASSVITTVVATTEATPVPVDIPPGATIYPNGSIIDFDGTIITPAGSIVNPDGSVSDSDGNVLIEANPDATTILPVGPMAPEEASLVSADGSVSAASELTVNDEGIVVNEDGIPVFIPDVYVAIPPGAVFNEDGSINMDGEVYLELGYKISANGDIVDEDGTVLLPSSEEYNVVLPVGSQGISPGLISPDGDLVIIGGSKVLKDGTIMSPYGEVLQEGANAIKTTTTAAPPVSLANDERYVTTADYHAPNLGSNLIPIQGSSTEYPTTNGLFGFGDATELDSSEERCLSGKSFPKGWCGNPANCLEGLSASMWIFVNITEVDRINFYSMLPADDEYIFSTGGDTEGDPGFAMKKNKMMLMTVVSTGNKVWEVNIAAPFITEIWNNVGFTWSYTDGLFVYLNSKEIGTSKFSNDVFKKDPLNPLELMIGCTRTASNPDYRGFYNGNVDEFAMWNRQLKGEDISYMLGGYKNGSSKMEAVELLLALDQMDMADPEAFSSMIDMMEGGVLDSLTDSGATSPINGTDDEEATEISEADPTPNPNLASDLQIILRIFDKMADVKNLKTIMTTEEMCQRMNISFVVDSLINEKTVPTWKDLQKDKVTLGSTGIINKYEAMIKKVLQKTNIRPNVNTTYCTKAASNLVIQTKKERLFQLWRTNHVRFMDESDRQLDVVKHIYDFDVDHATVNSRIFNDGRCKNRVVSTNLVFYDDYDKAAPLFSLNEDYIPVTDRNFLDSRVMSFHVSIDPPYTENNDIDIFQPACTPDMNIMRDYKGFTFTLKHFRTQVTQRSLRKTLFHADEVITDINARQCVQWNDAIGPYGGWDPAGCKIVATSADKTTCTCQSFGRFAVLVEKVKYPTVYEEPTWLSTVKYILYIVSGCLLGLYCFIVLISGDLKEQFHLLGMNLSLITIGGSITMMFSDLTDIRIDRHSCVIIGTLLHFFYVASGMLIICLAHASFKAVTGGIINGFLEQYLMITYGVALISVGIPFAGFMHDLGTDLRCFIAFDPSIKLAFFVPQWISVVVGIFFALVIFANLRSPKLRKQNLVKDYGSFALGGSILFIYFGLTWTFGFFAYVHIPSEVPFFYVAFQLMNSCMGIVIFITIGIFSKKYLRVFRKKAEEKRNEMRNGKKKNSSKAPVEDKFLDNEDFYFKTTSASTLSSTTSKKN